MDQSSERRELHISAAAALAIWRQQRGGYRGVALLVDPEMGVLVVMRMTDRGCLRLADAPIPDGQRPEPSLTALPDLRIPEDATEADIWGQVSAALRRGALELAELVEPRGPAH